MSDPQGFPPRNGSIRVPEVAFGTLLTVLVSICAGILWYIVIHLGGVEDKLDQARSNVIHEFITLQADLMKQQKSDDVELGARVEGARSECRALVDNLRDHIAAYPTRDEMRAEIQRAVDSALRDGRPALPR